MRRIWRPLLVWSIVVGLAGVFLAIGVFVATMIACDCKRSATREVFETIQLGDTGESVLSKMGTPSHIETSEAVYRAADAEKCQGVCAERLWWEHPVCLDEAWIVELDNDHKVSGVGGIFSP